MDRPSGKRIIQTNFTASFLLLVIVIGSSISSIVLMALTTSPQEAWASHLAAPTLSSPTNNLVINDATPNLDWSNVATASGYRVLVDNNNDFSSITYSVITGSTSQQNNAGPFSDGTYFWKVAARSSTGDAFGANSTVFSFTVDTANPPAPTLVSPSDGAFTSDTTPFFDWNPVTDPAGINRYTLQVGDEVDFSGTNINQQITTGSPVDSQADLTTVLAPGTYYWHVRARDGFNQQGDFSVTRSFTVDTIAPATAPALSDPTNGASINDNTPTFDWGDVSDAGTVTSPILYELLVDTDNAFPSPDISQLGLTTSTFTPSAGSELTDSTYFWKVRAKDSAGNFGPFSSTFTFTLDTIPPVAPVITVPTDGDILNTAISEISGTSESEGLTIEVIDSTLGSLGTTTSTAGGAWTLTLGAGSELTDGTYSLTANATDLAGNPGPASDAVDVTVDTIPPVAPVITVPTDGDILNTAISEISGTSESEGLTIEVIDSTLGSLGTTTSTAGGAWTLTLGAGSELTDGTYSLTANATDLAGNPGPASDAVDVTVDTIPPVAPVITVPTDGDILNTAISEISGTSESEGLTIEVIDSTLGSLGTTTSTAGGAWTLTLGAGSELTDGTYSLTANATDLAGNPGPASDAVDVTVDTIPPVAPVITVPTDGDILNTAISEISGTSESEGLTIEVIDSTLGSLGTTTSTAGGAWTLTLGAGSELTDGTYSLTANATDLAGNPGPASDAVDVTVDTIPPVAPVITVPTDGDILNTAISEISGTSESEGLTIEVIDSTLGSLGTTTSTAGGAWTLTLGAGSELTDGTYSLTANATDLAGNPGPASDAVDVTVDTIPPVAPVITVPTDGDILNTAISEISGTSESEGLTIEVIDSTLGSLGTTTSTAGGAWTLTLGAGSELTDGTYSLTANATDLAGNPGPASDAVDVTVDTTIEAPSITDPVDGTQNTAISTITGTSEASSLTIEVFDDTTSLGTTTSGAGGAWTLTLGTALGDGEYSFTATASDGVNTSPASAAVAVTVDTTIEAPSITDPVDGTQNTAISTISGTSEASSLTIEVFDDTTSLGTTTSGAGGAWTLTLGTALGDGEYSFTATASDGVNTSPASAAVAVTVDTTPTTITTSMSLQLSVNKATPGAGFTASGKLIDALADSPIAGQTITFTIDGTSVGAPVTTNNKGEFNIQLTAPTAIGDHAIQAHFEAFGQYDASESPVRTLKVEGAAPADTSLTLQLSKNKINAGSSYSASGTLNNEITKKPIAGITISVTTDGSGAVTGITDSKGKYDITLTAPVTNGDHEIQAHFAGNSQYESSDSPIKKVTVQGGTTFALTTTAATDTSLSLRVDGNDKMAGGADFTVSGKLIDSVSKKPIFSKDVSVTTDGDSGTDTTNSKGEFEIDLKAPNSAGKHDVKAQFNGDAQYKSSDSTVKITVEETKVSSQKTTVTTNQETTDEETDEQTDEETEEQPEEPEEEQPEEPEEEQPEEPEEEPEEETE